MILMSYHDDFRGAYILLQRRSTHYFLLYFAHFRVMRAWLLTMFV
jgi:hypothetical protein